jgi:hypothetical protein
VWSIIEELAAMDAPFVNERARPQERRLAVRLLAAFAAVLAAYLLIAYVTLPLVWTFYARLHPALQNLPGLTYTHNGHPGDPINVALIASEAEVKAIMHAAGWFPADPLGWRADVRIAADTVLKRSYETAPVSNLFLWGRKEDLAFEQPVGDNPRERHHVRFWRSAEVDDAGLPLWAGAATFDRRVGFSHTTGQITHHIAADVDTERDHVAQTLQATGQLSSSEMVADFHQVREGRNGGGDPWRTDGGLFVGAIGR